MSKTYKVYRHPERSEGSGIRFFGCCPQNDGESGRSMVEILGVLAVMGVLSFAGIAGYKNAMNKYRANELLNEASKRAVVVARQAMEGRTTVSLAEFSGHSQVAGATFVDDTPVDASGNIFAIKIKSVDEDVCQQMKNTIGTSTVVRNVPENCGEETISLVFNKDLSKSAGSNTNTEETSYEPVELHYCTEDLKCEDECEECSPSTGFCFKNSNKCPCTDSEISMTVAEEQIPACISCNLNSAAPSNLCEVCPNREVEDEYGECVLKCPNGYVYNPEEWRCTACNSLVAEETQWYTTEACQKCSDNRQMMLDGKGTQVCALKNCPQGYVRDVYMSCIEDKCNGSCSENEVCVAGVCHSCSELDAWFVGWSRDWTLCESLCANRELTYVLDEETGRDRYVCGISQLNCDSSGTHYFDPGTGSCVCFDECAEGEYCSTQGCVPLPGDTTGDCSPECVEGQQCVAGICLDIEEYSECKNNRDCNTWCEENEFDVCFCELSANYDNNSWSNFGGSCRGLNIRPDTDSKYVVGEGGLTTWWGAIKFCQAVGGRLATLSDLNITGGYQESAYCEGSDCTGNFTWSGLVNKLGHDGNEYWVKDGASCEDPGDESTCSAGHSNNSSNAFALYYEEDYGFIHVMNRDNAALLPVCKKN